ncbi:MAG: type II toxin-antitoxin system mRNA interferase toxin, RelE/StbE family [Rhodobiaceae bacterium]|nr:hypothetical protein [Rhodobiaceae bacterium]MCC0054327.1 type II toxin-antitoxin system mRNA interferase toxin, RelE/StbE family [Rhodobiaceae bacterium]
MPIVQFSETFKRALKALPTDRQQRIERAVLNFIADPHRPGLRFHKLQGLEVWSISSNRKDRVILEPVEGADEETWLLLDVGAHDSAYRRLNRQK